jgi:tetratricopeptide (TPR) repeat protein
MKRVFFVLMISLVVFCITIPSLLADEPEKKSDEANSAENIIIIKEPSEKEQGKEIIKEEKIVKLYESDEIRDLIAEIKRQREEIQSLRDEVARLSRLVEERPEPEKPLIRRGNGNPPRRLEPTQPLREYREPERLEPQREIIQPEEKRPEQVSEIESEINSLEEKISDQPYNKDARIKLAGIYKKVGRKEEAIFQYLETMRIKSIEENIKITMDNNPNNSETYLSIANLYKELGDLDNSLLYYEKYLKYKGFSGLSDEIKPRESEEAKSESDFNMGEVISSSAEEVVLKTFEGDTATFKVPKWGNKDGSYTPDKEISEMTQKLDKGKKVKIIWNKIEGQKIIQDIEILKKQ